MPKKYLRIANWGAIEKESGAVTAQAIRRLAELVAGGLGDTGDTIINNTYNTGGGTTPPPVPDPRIPFPLIVIGKPDPQIIFGWDPNLTWQMRVRSDGTYRLEPQQDDTFVLQPALSTRTSDYYAIRTSAEVDVLSVNSSGYFNLNNPTSKAAWITVANSSLAPTETDILALSPNIWLDANDPLGDGTDPSTISDDTDITDLTGGGWADKGSRGDNVTSSNGANAMPAWFKTAGTSPQVATLPNDKPYVSTVRGGVGTSNDISPTFQLGDLTLYAVMYLESAGTASTIVGGETGTDPGYTPSWVGVQDEDGSAPSFVQMRDNNESGDFQRTYNGIDLGGNGWRLVKFRRTGSTWTHEVDGTTITVALEEGIQSQPIWLNEYFQRSDDNGSSVIRSNVFMAELLIFDSALGTDDQTTIEDYLKNKYNVAGGMSGGGGAPFTQLRSNDDTVLTEFDETGKLHIGGEDPVASLQVTDTTEQARLGYDASNYLSVTVASDGSTTLALTGTATPTELTIPHGLNAVDYIQLDTTYTDGTFEGRLQWNSADGTLEYGLPGGSVNLQVGQEVIFLARNETGSTIPNGACVYINGATGSRPTIALAKADSVLTSAVAGVTTESIDHNSTGYVTSFGLVRDVDTSGAAAGSVIYLSATTAGEFTTTRPTAPDIKVFIGYSIFSNVSSGIIAANPTFQPSLTALNDVLEIAPSNQDVPIWNTTNSRFELATVGETGWTFSVPQSFTDTVDLTADILFTEIAAPGTPAANKATLYLDSTSGNLTIKKDDASTVDLEAGGGGGADPTSPNTWTADQTMNDNVKWLFGTGGDASITYNSASLVIKPDEVGSGEIIIDGTLNMTSDYIGFAEMTAPGIPAGTGTARLFLDVATQDLLLAHQRSGTNKNLTNPGGSSHQWTAQQEFEDGVVLGFGNGSGSNQDMELSFDSASNSFRMNSSNVGAAKVVIYNTVNADYTVFELQESSTGSHRRSIGWQTGGVSSPTMSTYGDGVKLILYDSITASTDLGTTIGIKSNGTLWFTTRFDNNNGGLESWAESGGAATRMWRITNAAILYCEKDNGGVFFGASSDARLTYDGTDVIMNTSAVGSGCFELSDHLRMVEMTAPGTPSTGEVHIYVDGTSGNLSVKKDTGSVVDLEAGGGGSGWNPTVTAVKTSGYSAVDDDVVLCDTSSGGFTVTLPGATANRRVVVKLVTAGNNLTVQGLLAPTTTIDGAASITLNVAGQARTMIADGSNWHII
jgi:hypothetical protein